MNSSQPQSAQSPPPDGKPQRPVGTAAAEAPTVSGVTAAQPAGVAIAPAKQRRVRTLVLKVGAYRGDGVPLPLFVTRAAKFGADQVRFSHDFLRVPILPHSLNLYASELKSLVLKGDLRNSFRLSLLPGLATAAVLEQKLTGSDKGIW